MGFWARMSRSFSNTGKEFNFAPPHRLGTTRSRPQSNACRKVKVSSPWGATSFGEPDTEYGAAGLRRCTLTAHVAIKLNRSHLVAGEEALILPTIGRSERDVQAGREQFVTVENSMGIVSKSQGRLEPPEGDLLAEPVIVARMAKATLGAPRRRLDALVADTAHPHRSSA